VIKTPLEIMQEMLRNDAFSNYLGIELVSADLGECVLRMTARKDMCNGHNLIHGGITYSMCDTALACASNSHGQKAVSIETQISYIAPAFFGDILTAKTKEINVSKSIARYEVECFNEQGKLISNFKGTVFRKQEIW
jgi:acyl-CoA thioesterase